MDTQSFITAIIGVATFIAIAIWIYKFLTRRSSCGECTGCDSCPHKCTHERKD